jgi:hypothetical protein
MSDPRDDCETKGGFMRGMNLCGWGYGSLKKNLDRTIVALHDINVDWVSLVVTLYQCDLSASHICNCSIRTETNVELRDVISRLKKENIRIIHGVLNDCA